MSTPYRTDDIAPQNGQPSMLEKLRQRRIAAEMARDVATESITKDERIEIEERKAIELADEERRKAEREKRNLDLDRREDVQRELHADDAKIASLPIDGYDDTFVVLHSAKAYAKWEHDIQAAGSNKKLDKAEIGRAYAVASVIDWNGITDFGPTSLNGHALIEFLKKHPAIATAIVNEASKLAGLYAEARKSGGR